MRNRVDARWSLPAGSGGAVVALDHPEPLVPLEVGGTSEHLGAAAYSEPSRHYRTQTHIEDCLVQLSRFRELAEEPHEIEVAIWFHDAVSHGARFPMGVCADP